MGDYCYSKGIVERDGGKFFDGSPLNIPHKKERESLQKCFSILATEEDPLAWIYGHHRMETEKKLYGGMSHQRGQ